FRAALYHLSYLATAVPLISTTLFTKPLAANLAVHRALSLGGYREAKQPTRWDRAEPSNYSKPCHSFKIPPEDSRRVFSASRRSPMLSRRALTQIVFIK
ncbi:MAG: hypothetical protein WBQ43_14120, partial [Terriglobales bacterium]